MLIEKHKEKGCLSLRDKFIIDLIGAAKISIYSLMRKVGQGSNMQL